KKQSVPNSVSGPLLERGFAFQLSLSGGDPDFIRSIRSGFPTAIGTILHVHERVGVPLAVEP
ncbi:hypothetical protein, partial [Streptomyces hiroshimensis]